MSETCFELKRLDAIFRQLHVVSEIIPQGKLAYSDAELDRDAALTELSYSVTTEGGSFQNALVELIRKLEQGKQDHFGYTGKVATTFFLRSSAMQPVTGVRDGEPSPELFIEVSGAFGYRKTDADKLDPMAKYIGSGQHVSFGVAIEALKLGYRAQRSVGWNGKGMFIYLVPASSFEVSRPPLNEIFNEGGTLSYQAHIDMFNAQGVCLPWVASQSDVLAEDWIILPRAAGSGKVAIDIPNQP